MSTSRLVRAAALGGLALALASPASAASLLPNGSFSLGQTGFSSGYTANADCWAEGTYYLGGSGSECHSLWTASGDHTTGTGRMMVVNGSTTRGVEVWSAEVAVEPATEYEFSGWLATLYPRSPASLQLSVNGISIAIELDAPTSVGTWQPVSGTWDSGAATSARLVLVNHNLEPFGNDLALDDLSFSPAHSATPTMIENPEPASITLLGLGLLGAALMHRRRRLAR